MYKNPEIQKMKKWLNRPNSCVIYVHTKFHEKLLQINRAIVLPYFFHKHQQFF